MQIEKNDEVLPAYKDAISKKLFAYISTDANDKADCEDKVILRSAKNRNDEVLRVAVDVAKGVREGKRYKDFEVFLSDLDAYAQEIKTIFSRYDIPFFIDKKELLSEQAKARFILETIACVRTGFRLNEVCDLLKNPLFATYSKYGAEGAYLFENYCLKYNVEHVPTKKEACFKRCEERKVIKGKEQKSGFINAKVDAVDTGGLMAEATRICGIDAHVPNGVPVTAIIMEATVGVDYADDFRLFTHSSVATVAQTVRVLSKSGRYRPRLGQKVYITHLH